jgi:glucokinase
LDSSAAASTIIDAFVTVADSAHAPPAARWGVAMPDPFDYAAGIARFEGVGKFDALFGLDIGAALREQVRPRPSTIGFINDADAFTLGEWLNGAGTGATRCTGLTLGTGVGSGWVADGLIVDSGPDVPPGGRAHRLFADGAPLEDVMSRRAIRRAYLTATGIEADVAEICERARAGEAAARAVLEHALHTLGITLGPLLSRFGAEVVVVGGSMAGSWDVLGPPFAAGLGPAASTLRVIVAADADRAPLLGAAYRAVALS